VIPTLATALLSLSVYLLLIPVLIARGLAVNGGRFLALIFFVSFPLVCAFSFRAVRCRRRSERHEFKKYDLLRTPRPDNAFDKRALLFARTQQNIGLVTGVVAFFAVYVSYGIDVSDPRPPVDTLVLILFFMTASFTFYVLASEYLLGYYRLRCTECKYPLIYPLTRMHWNGRCVRCGLDHNHAFSSKAAQIVELPHPGPRG
jgi:hypothetical protein